jgi:hypothetical protein
MTWLLLPPLCDRPPGLSSPAVSRRAPHELHDDSNFRPSPVMARTEDRGSTLSRAILTEA